MTIKRTIATATGSNVDIVVPFVFLTNADCIQGQTIKASLKDATREATVPMVVEIPRIASQIVQIAKTTIAKISTRFALEIPDIAAIVDNIELRSECSYH